MSEVKTRPSGIFFLDGNLYNIVHGVNPFAYFLLGTLGIPPEQTGRFRDCYMVRATTGELEIHLYTRNGGGNRRDHEAVTTALRAHPRYLRDFDATSDHTYASYVFGVPAEVRDELELCCARDPESALPRSHEIRQRVFETLMKEQPNHPEVLRVQAVLKPTLDEIARLVRTSANAAVGLLDKD